VPADCLQEAVAAIQLAVETGNWRGKAIKQRMVAVLDNPQGFVNDEHFGTFAQALLA
jgi:hypothetical protein